MWFQLGILLFGALIMGTLCIVSTIWGRRLSSWLSKSYENWRNSRGNMKQNSSTITEYRNGDVGNESIIDTNTKQHKQSKGYECDQDSHESQSTTILWPL